MRIKILVSGILLGVLSLAPVATVDAATPAQYGAKCNAAWTGKRGRA